MTDWRWTLNIACHEHDISECKEIDIQPNVKRNNLTKGTETIGAGECC